MVGSKYYYVICKSFDYVKDQESELYLICMLHPCSYLTEIVASVNIKVYKVEIGFIYSLESN